MFCSLCGKSVPEDAHYCHYCGASLKANEKPAEYVQRTFVARWQRGKGGSYSLGDRSEFTARAYFWSHHQERICGLLDSFRTKDGIVPVSEVGPGAVKLREHSGGLFSPPWAELAEIRIVLRGTQSALDALKGLAQEVTKEAKSGPAIDIE